MRAGAARRGASDRLAALAVDSPLRRVDPRVKLALSLALSLAIVLPLEKLLVLLLIYTAFLAWARLLPVAERLLWRLKWVLVTLFIVDWVLVSFDLAVLVSLRVLLLSASFVLVFATTTPTEFQLALEWVRLPYRYAFSVGVAVQSLALVEQEWRTIVEAQRARGAWAPPGGWRKLVGSVRDAIALAVPAVVMTAHRAWSMTEAACARGFDAPCRKSFRQLRMGWLDWVLLGAGSLIAAALVLWR
jgi:energy-coupling factor transport system permease protein